MLVYLRLLNKATLSAFYNSIYVNRKVKIKHKYKLPRTNFEQVEFYSNLWFEL